MTEPVAPQAIDPPTTDDLPDLLTRPYNPSDFKNQLGQWFPFDKTVEAQVILNDLENGRLSSTGLWRLLSELLTDDVGGDALTFAAPLLKEGTTVSLVMGNGVQNTGGALEVKPSDAAGNALTVAAAGVFVPTPAEPPALTAGNGIDITGGAVSVKPSGAAGNTLTVSAAGAFVPTPPATNLVAGNGIDIASGVVSLKVAEPFRTTAQDGLVLDVGGGLVLDGSSHLTVNTGNGLEISGNAVTVKPAGVAGNGLTVGVVGVYAPAELNAGDGLIKDSGALKVKISTQANNGASIAANDQGIFAIKP